MSFVATVRARSGTGRSSSCALLAVAILICGAAGCRGKTSAKPPRILLQDMHNQLAIRSQSQLPRALGAGAGRSIPVGALPREAPVQPGVFELGKANGAYVPVAPVAVDEVLLSQGETRFNIYCSVCHDRAGSGRGINPQRGFPGPIDLASDNTRAMLDGQIFEVISRGVRNMPEMGDQIPVADRWAIVVWVRVLQRSQHARISDVETKEIAAILPEEAEP